MSEPAIKQASLGAQVLLQGQELKAIGSRMSGIENNVQLIFGKLDAIIIARQPKIIQIISVIAAILAPFWFVLSLQIEKTSSPVKDIASRALTLAEANTNTLTEMAKALPTIMSQNADSIRDRNDQRARSDRQADTQTKMLETLAREVAQRKAKGAEIETQFRAFEGYANLQRVYDNRMFALLWEKVYQTNFPPFQYYPKISADGQSEESEQ